MRYVVKQREYIGVSFKLLKKINVKMSAATREVSFFKDRSLDAQIEKYVQEKASSMKIRKTLICQGMAKVMDDTVQNWLGDTSTRIMPLCHLNQISKPHKCLAYQSR